MHTVSSQRVLPSIIYHTHKYRITYDSNKEDAFLVHTDKGIIRFVRTMDGLYAYKPSPKFKQQVAEAKRTVHEEANYLVATVEENRKRCTEQQFQNA